MKKLFKAIRDKDFELVIQLISSNPELANCTAKQPPKKDDGQSPLQVALKTGAFEIANYLIDNGADLNFMEDESCCNVLYLAFDFGDGYRSGITCQVYRISK